MVIVLKLLPEDFCFISFSPPPPCTVTKLHSHIFSHALAFLSGRSEFALIYNDRSVQESHHLSAAFRLLQDDQMNIFINLTREEWM